MPVFFCDPDLCEVVPAGGYVLADGPSPSEMAAALTELSEHPERIGEMSALMMKHRKEVLMSKRIVRVEKIFREAIK